MTINRQPQGIPTGGQFAATAHSESAVVLERRERKTVTDHFLDRESILGRRQRLEEQMVRIKQLQAAHSLRSAAATTLARFPGAATLRVAVQDDTGSYSPISIANADGGLLELNTSYNDPWIAQPMVYDGPNIRDLVEDLDPDDDSWTEGVGFVHGRGTRKTVDINLQAAVNAPDPFIAEEHDPRTRTLSLDEQTDLVEAANHGIIAMEDILEDNNSFDEHRQFEVLENLKDRVDTLLKVTTKED